jgi:glycerate kinase
MFDSCYYLLESNKQRLEVNIMGAAGGAAVAAAAVADAIKASGAIVRVDPANFRKILDKADSPLIVRAEGGFLSKNYQYLTAYKGLVFYTKSSSELMFGDVEIIMAKKIWIPG